MRRESLSRECCRPSPVSLSKLFLGSTHRLRGGFFLADALRFQCRAFPNFHLLRPLLGAFPLDSQLFLSHLFHWRPLFGTGQSLRLRLFLPSFLFLFSGHRRSLPPSHVDHERVVCIQLVACLCL